MRAVDIIMKKREGERLGRDELVFFVNGYLAGEIPDYQMSALLMAVYFRGMSPEETASLTRIMRDSGEVIDLSAVRGTKIDKHSTGGVGDKVSLVLAPLAASCGLKVPMMAGRGLGHTGGTLDKCSSIPGFSVRMQPERLKKALAEVGYAIIGQSEDMVPADRLMYALRDVTATVESVPLITASILSKKCAEGSDGFVFDVKTGSGAFMKTMEEAEILAGSLCETGRGLGKKVTAVITDMDEPLGYTVGNFCEVRETCECLQGRGPDDVTELAIGLTSHMLVMGGVCSSLEEAEARCREKLENGAAWAAFLKHVAFQGGDVRVIEDPEKGPAAVYSRPLLCPDEGYIGRIDAYKTGLAACMLGAGRLKKDDDVDPACGIVFRKKRGDTVSKGEEIAMLMSNSEAAMKEAGPLLSAAVTVSKDPVSAGMRMLKVIGGA
ncbi:MAG: thymidine phosphorylase [Spirochaetales bacterium]|nr:thymidine phosphorylase [Spirochaetales bacterium]